MGNTADGIQISSSRTRVQAGHLRPGHTELFQALLPGFRIPVQRDAYNLKVLISILCVSLNHFRHFLTAGAAPACPEVNQHQLAFACIVGQLNRTAFGVFHLKIDKLLSDGRSFGRFKSGLQRHDGRIVPIRDGKEGNEFFHIVILHIMVVGVQQERTQRSSAIGANARFDDGNKLAFQRVYFRLISFQRVFFRLFISRRFGRSRDYFVYQRLLLVENDLQPVPESLIGIIGRSTRNGATARGPYHLDTDVAVFEEEIRIYRLQVVFAPIYKVAVHRGILHSGKPEFPFGNNGRIQRNEPPFATFQQKHRITIRRTFHGSGYRITLRSA